MKIKVLAITLLGTILVGCATSPASVDDYITYYTDPETGVCYLIYDGPSYDGGMTVRYNTDGSIMVKNER